MTKVELLLPEPMLPSVQREIDERFIGHRLWEANDKDGFIRSVSDRVRGIARGRHVAIGRELIERLPRLLQVSEWVMTGLT